MTNPLNQVFNMVTYDSNTSVAVVPITPIQAIADPTIDFGIARDNLIEAIKVGTDALKVAAQIAGGAQTPEHFMAVASLLNGVTKASQAMMGNLKEVTSIGKKEGPQEQHNHIHFSGSTEELGRMLKTKSDD